MSRTFIRFPEGKTKALTFSYDDGVSQDERLIEIFNKRGLKGTFNLNTQHMGKCYNEFQTLVTREKTAELYRGHEVAVHGYDHDFPTKIPTDRVLYEIFKDRCNLEEITGTIVRGMAYPWGDYDERTIKAAEIAGIEYSRVVGSTESFKIPVDWLRLTPTCHHNNSRLFELAEKFTEKSPLEEPYDRDGWLFYVWGHAYEFDINKNWDRIEEFADKVCGKKDVWYATNIEIHDYVESYRKLRYSADGETVANLSSFDIWLERDRKLVQVPSGATVKL